MPSLTHPVPGHRPALDRGRHQPVDVETVADQLEQAQLGLLGPPVGRRHLAANGIGRLAQGCGSACAIWSRATSSPSSWRRSSAHSDPTSRSARVEVAEDGQMAHDPAHHFELAVGHPAFRAATSTIVWMSAAW